MSLRIIPFTAAQIGAYKALRLQALRDAPDAFSGDYAVESNADDRFHLMRLQVGAVFGAYKGEVPAGMAGLITYPEPKLAHKGIIWGVYVDPAYRGQGVARALMRHILAALPPAVTHLSLSVEENNKGAIALYQSLGFQSYGIEPGAFRNGDTLHNEHHMVKIL